MKSITFHYHKTGQLSFEDLSKEASIRNIPEAIEKIANPQDPHRKALYKPFEKTELEKITELVTQKKNAILKHS